MKISNTYTTKKCHINDIELSDEAIQILHDFDEQNSFLTHQARQDGTWMDGAYFCTGDLADLLETIKTETDLLYSVQVSTEILTELKQLLALLQAEGIEEVVIN